MDVQMDVQNDVEIPMKELNLKVDSEVRIQFIETCCICLEEDELDYTLECCHNNIHSICIEKWYTFKKTVVCPLCRHESNETTNTEDHSFLHDLIPTENEARIIIRPLIYLVLYMIVVVIVKMK